MIDQIKTHTNPDNRKNWIITVEINTPIKITLRVIPDKLIADHQSLKDNIIGLINQEWDTPEKLILTIIERVNNELIPKWIEVTYNKDGISVKVEDQQPGQNKFKAPYS